MKIFFGLAVALPLLAQVRPVVLVNGFQSDCSSLSSSSATFGQMEQLLSRVGFRVLFFDNCSVASASGRPSIEELGQAFGKFVAASSEAEVDVVAHSMGGLIVRSYLAGKLPGGGFTPPARPRIRKVVFLSTPHAGALAISGFVLDTEKNVQARQLLQGSSFLWELATWNQGTDDLREVDAISVVADGGASTPVAKSHDGAVPVTSSAFALSPDHIRVLPYCHQQDLPSLLCRGPGIAYAESQDHLGFRIVKSFLLDTVEWTTIGQDVSQSPVLSKYGGAMIRVRNAQNESSGDSRLFWSGGNIAGELPYNQEQQFFADLLPAAEYQVRAGSGQRSAIFSTAITSARYLPLLLKTGPNIAAVGAGVPLRSLSRAPGMIVSLFGSNMEGSTVKVAGHVALILYSSSRQVNLVIPEGLTGLVSMRLENDGGIAETQVLLEAAVPVVFSQNGVGTGAALAYHLDGSPVGPGTPAKPGEILSIYMTGLGSPAENPAVTVNDRAAEVLGTEKPASQPGIDIVAVEVPSLLPADSFRLVVRAGQRSSNELTLDIAP